MSVNPLTVPVTVPATVTVSAAVAVLAEVAVMFAVVDAETGEVDTVKVAEVCPAAMVTEAGTVADPLEEANVTRTPPAAAGAFNVTVPVEDPPPAMVVGFNVKPLMVPEVPPPVPASVSVAETVLADVAVMVTVAPGAPAVVEAMKVAEVWPAGITTDEGTVTPALFDERSTRTPPAGAALARVMVPVEACPGVTDVGFSVNPPMVPVVRALAPIASEAVIVFAEVAVRMTVAEAGTAVVVTGNVTEVWPAGTTSEASTEAAALFDERFTRTPPVGAGALNVTVAVEDSPPVTAVGFSVKLPIVAVEALEAPMVSGVVIVFAETACMVAVVAVDAGVVVTTNVAEVCPAGTVTEGSTTAAALFEESVTSTPPVGAGEVNVTVPVELWPPVTVDGFNVRLPTVPFAVPDASTVSVA